MKLSWRNGVAYLLLAGAVAQYILSAPFLIQQLGSGQALEETLPMGDKLGALVAWLVGPAYLIGWAGVVEYLSRIADAMQRKAQQP
jgi:hypothetical protein